MSENARHFKTGLPRRAVMQQHRLAIISVAVFFVALELVLPVVYGKFRPSMINPKFCVIVLSAIVTSPELVFSFHFFAQVRARSGFSIDL